MDAARSQLPNTQVVIPRAIIPPVLYFPPTSSGRYEVLLLPSRINLLGALYCCDRRKEVAAYQLFSSRHTSAHCFWARLPPQLLPGTESPNPIFFCFAPSLGFNPPPLRVVRLGVSRQLCQFEWVSFFSLFISLSFSSSSPFSLPIGFLLWQISGASSHLAFLGSLGLPQLGPVDCRLASPWVQVPLRL